MLFFPKSLIWTMLCYVHFTTFSWQDLAVQARVENIRFMKDPNRSIRGNTRIGPVLEVKVSNHLGRCGIEIKIDSMQKDELSP